MSVSVDVKQLSPRAKRALVDLKAEFEERLRLRKLLYLPPGVLTPLSDEYERRLKEIVLNGMETTRSDRPVRVKCPQCARQSTIAGDIERWSCHCSPRVERFAFPDLSGGLTLELKTPISIAEAVLKAREVAQGALVQSAAKTAQANQKATFKAVTVTDQGVIVGIGSAAHIVDRDGEAVAQDALIGLAFDFCASKARTFKANHDEEIECDLVASWPGAPILKSGKVLAAAEELPADDPVVGINIEKGNETHWFVEVRPKDERIVKAARDGEIVGFSWGGFATKE